VYRASAGGLWILSGYRCGTCGEGSSSTMCKLVPNGTVGIAEEGCTEIDSAVGCAWGKRVQGGQSFNRSKCTICLWHLVLVVAAIR